MNPFRRFWGGKRMTSRDRRHGDVESPSANGLLSVKNLPQPQWMRFEDANGWEPAVHTVMYCLNGQDNVPTRIKLNNDFAYYISQNRSPGHKDQGQDCMVAAEHGDWQVHLLCDGHDKAGHMVALGVCQQLPKILLRKIHERNQKNPSEKMNPVSDRLVNEAFDETAKVVCWTRDGITVGLWVKVFEGQWSDKPGFIKENSGSGKVKVAIIDENGYHLPSLDKSTLRRPRYTGGCTCVCLIRNTVTKQCKVAVSGDSRLMVLPTMGVNDAVLLRQPGMSEEDEALLTPAHNVFNEDEKMRLKRDFDGQYEFDGNFLVNPITKFAIQPTRGFGDFDMFGTGYTHRPEITKTFKLEPNGLILTASDGLFDTHVWADEEIVSCLGNFLKDGLTNVQIIDRMYRETLERSHEGGYVDDISIFCFIEPEEKPKEEKEAVATKELEIIKDENLPKPKKNPKKNTKENRRTIERGAKTYTDLNQKLEELKKKREKDKHEVDDVGEILDEEEEVRNDVGKVIRNLAKSSKTLGTVDPSMLLHKNKKEKKEESEVEEEEEAHFNSKEAEKESIEKEDKDI